MNAYPAKTVIAGPVYWKCSRCKMLWDTRAEADYCCSPEQRKKAEEEDIKKNGLTCEG